MDRRVSLHALSRLAAFPLLVAAAGPAGAVDGAIEISHVRVLAGGITASDTPGYPATVDATGRYVLTSNLRPPGLDLHGIHVLANDVTVDLNGFAVLGPVTCTGSIIGDGVSCSGAGAGVGVLAGADAVTVRDGTVRGMAGGGIRLSHGSVRSSPAVRDVVAVGNGGVGIEIVRGAVSGCSARQNRSSGIEVGVSSLVVGNVAEVNGEHGILVRGGSTILDNVLRFEFGAGISGSFSSTFRGNTAVQNRADGLSVEGASLVIANTSASNGGSQLAFRIHPAISPATGGYRENVFRKGEGTGLVTGGGTSLGDNLCDGTPC